MKSKDTKKFTEYYRQRHVTETYDKQRQGSDYRIIKRHLELKCFLELLDKKYGPGDWQKQFKGHYRGQTTGLEQAIYEAQGRSLVIYHK